MCDLVIEDNIEVVDPDTYKSFRAIIKVNGGIFFIRKLFIINFEGLSIWLSGGVLALFRFVKIKLSK